jgi:hypothetical protein
LIACGVANTPGFNEGSIHYDVYFSCLSAFEQLDDFVVYNPVEVFFSDSSGKPAKYTSGVAFLVIFDKAQFS